MMDKVKQVNNLNEGAQTDEVSNHKQNAEDGNTSNGSTLTHSNTFSKVTLQ